MMYNDLCLSIPEQVSKRSIFKLQEQIKYSFVATLCDYSYSDSEADFWIVARNCLINSDFFQQLKSTIDTYWINNYTDANDIDFVIRTRFGFELYHWFLLNENYEAKNLYLKLDKNCRIVLKAEK